MSDLLTRLASRAVGESLQVRPRARPAFGGADTGAPISAFAAAPADVTASALPDPPRRDPAPHPIGARDDAARSPQRRDAPAALRGTDRIAAERESIVPRSAVETDTGTPAIEADSAGGDVVPAVHGTAMAQPGGLRELQHARDAQPFAAARGAADVASRRRRPNVDEPHRAPTRMTERSPLVVTTADLVHAIGPAAAADEREPPAQQSPAREPSAREAPAHAIARLAADAHSFAEPRADARRASSGTRPTLPAPRGEAHAEPVVRVTIGRVEIRATMPPAPAAPRPGAVGPRPLSLNDYLAGRKGRSR